VPASKKRHIIAIPTTFTISLHFIDKTGVYNIIH
jgi:hypothetical protein